MALSPGKEAAATDAPAPVIVEADEKELMNTPDIHNVSVKLQRAKDAYKEFGRIEEQPSKGEIGVWYIYGLCSYFIHTVLIPIVFPLVISQIVSPPPMPEQGWNQSLKGISCTPKEMKLYEGLIHPSIIVRDFKFSPLEWTALSWAAGIVLACPILGYISPQLDHGRNQHLIFAGATVVGSFFCLPIGFFKFTWIFLPYIAAIVVANIIGTASHTRHLGLMVRGFTGLTTGKFQFPERRTVASSLSMYATAAGCLGAGIISAFTYRMLHHSEKLNSLWIVCIFSGLKWSIGTINAFSVNRPGVTIPATWAHIFSIFKYPHAVGSLVGVFLSSFVSTCIFMGGMLYVVGQLCLKPRFFLFLWLIYFIFPLFSFPILHILQLLFKTDAVRMQLLGLLLSATTSGVGFYFRDGNWNRYHILLVVALQSMSTGILHAFGRVLLLDCTPAGKEGAFSVWFAWVRTLGACGGFAVASMFLGNVGTTFSIAFCTTIAGICILIFGNISNFGGAMAAGHVKEDVSEMQSPVSVLDKSIEKKTAMHMEAWEEGKLEA